MKDSLVKECMLLKIIYDIPIDSNIHNNTCGDLFS